MGLIGRADGLVQRLGGEIIVNIQVLRHIASTRQAGAFPGQRRHSAVSEKQ